MSKVTFFEAQKIYEGAWQISYAFNRREGAPVYTYLVEGRDYALVIDTMYGYGNLKAFCETLTHKPLKLVNTHFHGDHTGGNSDFDACYIHHLDIPYLYSGLPGQTGTRLEATIAAARPELAQLIEPSDVPDDHPIQVYPLYDGDCFDLGDRKLEVIYVGGHSPGSICLLDRANRALFTGDACNGNTLLNLGSWPSVEEYLGNLLHLMEFRSCFDVTYGGHQIIPATVIDEGVETTAKVVAGTDDKMAVNGPFGPVLYAAKLRKEGFGREDGKSFNMAYTAERVHKKPRGPQVIGAEMPSPF